MTQKHCTSKKGSIIQIDEESVKKHLGEIVKGTVQETLNNLSLIQNTQQTEIYL
jgi:citrate lyase gamma subunit